MLAQVSKLPQLKAFNIYGKIFLTIFALASVIFITSTTYIYHRSNGVSCPVSMDEKRCRKKYEKEFLNQNPIVYPMLSAFIIALLSVVYGIIGYRIVRTYDEATFAKDVAPQTEQTSLLSKPELSFKPDCYRFDGIHRRIQLSHIFTYHLLLGMIACLAWTSYFFSRDFPVSFECERRSLPLNSTENSEGTISRMTCENSKGHQFQSLFEAHGCLYLISFLRYFIEFIYFAYLYSCKDKYLVSNWEFIPFYLKGDRPRITKLIECIKENTEIKQDVLQKIGKNSPGVLIKDSSKQDQQNKDGELYQIDNSKEEPPDPLFSAATLFSNQQFKKILIEGLWKSSKTFCAHRILHAWKNAHEKDFWYDKLVIQVNCPLPSGPDVSFQKMLKGLELFQWRCTRSAWERFVGIFLFMVFNPSKVIFLFDEVPREVQTSSNSNEGDSAGSYLDDLLCGEYIKGARLVAFSRPKSGHCYRQFKRKFDKVFILSGFPLPEIEKCVKEFVTEGDQSNRVWKMISEHMELKSLCSVPFVCYIVCTILNEKIKECKRRSVDPTNLDEDYQAILNEILENVVNEFLKDANQNQKQIEMIKKLAYETSLKEESDNIIVCGSDDYKIIESSSLLYDLEYENEDEYRVRFRLEILQQYLAKKWKVVEELKKVKLTQKAKIQQ